MCCVDHVAIYTPFWVIVLVSSCCQIFPCFSASLTSPNSTTISIISTKSFSSSTVLNSTFSVSTQQPGTTQSPNIEVIENLTATTINSSAIKLEWDFHNGYIDGHKLNISWRKIPSNSISNYITVDKNETAKIIDGLEVWTEYLFRIEIYNENNSVSNLNITEKTGPSAPSKPSKFDSNSTSTMIYVQWKEPDKPNGPLDGYEILLNKENKLLSNETLERNITEKIFKDLDPWTNYSIVIIAYNIWKSNKLTNEISTIIQTLFAAPSIPRNFTAFTNSSNAIFLKWIAPESPNGPLDGFRITYWRNKDGPSDNKIIDVNFTSILIDDLDPWTWYNFSIVAFNRDLLSKEVNTSQKTASGAPSIPRNFTANTESSNTILLKWNAPESPNGPLDGFKITYWKSEDRSLINKTVVNGSVTSILIDNLDPWTIYSFSIVAFNADLLSEEARISRRTAPDVPSIPRNFTGVTNSSKTIFLTWNAPESPNGPLNGFRIIYWKNEDGSSTNKTVNGTVTSILIDNLDPWTRYNFSIVAFNGNLSSEEAKTSERTAPDKPSEPRNLTAISKGAHAITLNWIKPFHPRGPIDGYRICWKMDVKWDLGQCLNINNTSIPIKNLRSWTMYIFDVSAYNKWNSEEFISNKIEIRKETERLKLDQPTEMKVILINLTTTSISWKPPKHDLNITGYNITWIKQRECKESANLTNFHSWLTVNSPICMISDLKPATDYAFYIYAFIEKNNEYLIGSQKCINIRTEEGLPVRPENVTCVAKNSTAINISWEEPSSFFGNIINYTIYFRKISDLYNEIIEMNTEDKYLIVTNLEYYTEYEFNISAWTAKGQGEFSEPLICRTDSSIPNSVSTINIYNIFPNNITVEWSPPKPYPGPVNYTLKIFEVNSCDKTKMQEKFIETLIGYKSNNKVLRNLMPYTIYRVKIDSATSAGNKESDFKETRTSPSRPGPLRNVYYNCKFSSVDVSLIIPEKPNGKIKGFFIHYIGEKGDKNYHDDLPISNKGIEECDTTPISITINKLRPEYSYNFSIYVNTSFDGEGDAYKFHCTLPAGLPPYPTSNITIVTRSKRQITFVLRKDMFSDQMGDIVEYAVIVAEAKHIGDKEKGERDKQKLPTWADFETNSTVLIYQATPDLWNPFNTTLDDPMSCQSVENGKKCVLGYESRCNEKEKTYCNGPLRPGISYGIKIRGYTRSGFSETPPIVTYTTPDEIKNAKGGLIIAIVVSLLFLMLLITGVFIYKKFGIISRFFGKTVMENSTETNDIGFMTIIAKSRPIKLSEFAGHVSAMMADSALKFSQEFEELRSISPSHTCSIAQMQENKLKNRWINILPFDHSRVKLLPMDDEPGSDYINASYIPGFNSHREYIATQGPLPNTVDDMWRMIWEHGISMIVMLTQCVERGKTKCEQYWPSDKEDCRYGDLKVQTIHDSILSDYTIRTFDVSLGERHRIITQMHFTKWPDFGCPENTELLINFVRTVRDRMVENDPHPILVHCSAGVGRTGTFIAVNRLVQHIDVHDVVDVFHIVLDMRQHRTNMVQTEDQYIYIHECVRDLIQEKFARNNESYKDDDIYGNLRNSITTNI